MKACFISEDARPVFERAGLTGYDNFLALEGDLVSKNGKRPVCRIVLSDGTEQKMFYLKKTSRCPARDLFKRIRKGVGLHGDAYLENAQVELYKRSGIPVMHIAAWGEHRIFGLPVAGFLLAAEVPGKRLDQVIRICTASERKTIFFRYGELIAKMHSSGLRDIARVQDIIYSDENGGNLTVIDREHGIPKTTPMTDDDCINALARTQLKNLSEIGGNDPMTGELSLLIQGYLNAMLNKTFSQRYLEASVAREIGNLITVIP
jgi:hypothetical protein